MLKCAPIVTQCPPNLTLFHTLLHLDSVIKKDPGLSVVRLELESILINVLDRKQAVILALLCWGIPVLPDPAKDPTVTQLSQYPALCLP